MMKKFYYPGEKFPSISITGDSCSLSCPHCDGKFLENMKSIQEEDELYRFALDLDDSGGNGFLLSGGCDERGRVPINDFIETLTKIKDNTSLLINVHTGLPSNDVVESLIDSGIDIISYDMIGSQNTIRNIYGIDASPEDYKERYNRMVDNGLKVIPHVTVGLNEGNLNGEFKAVEMVDRSKRIILNTLIPLDFGKRVKKEDFFSVVDYIPDDTEIIMGCMRERGRHDLEIRSLKKGVEGIVLPSKKTVKWAQKRYDVKKLERCCAF